MLRSFVVALLLLAGCQRGAAPVPTPTEPEWFADVTDRLGIKFVHEAGPTGTYFLPQIIGSGGAALDFDGDGRLDLLLLQNGGPQSTAKNALYRQTNDGTFEDVGAGSGLDFAGWNMGAAVGDVNNDGRPDVVITQYGGLKLFLGSGASKFRDVTAEAGLASRVWGTSACFVDYDRDGRLDLAVVNYVDYDPSQTCQGLGGKNDYCHPKSFPGTSARLYRNLSAAGQVKFADVTLASGLAQRPGRGLGLVAFDADGDGWPDLFAANDDQENFLWINQRDGTFKEEAVYRGVAFNGLGQTQGNMGVAIADFDGDLRFDLFVTHLTEETSTLYRQGQPGRFQDATAVLGLADSRWRATGFGAVAADFNHDGGADLAVVSGRVAAKTASNDYWAAYRERAQFFAHAGPKFRDLSPSQKALSGTGMVGRGLIVADLDNDGAMDLVLTQIAGPARVLRNVAPDRGHWLRVRVVDAALKRDAYGAVVTVHAGGKRWSALAHPAHSYLVSNDPRVHFGLGSAATVERIEVHWPDGSREAFPGGAADKMLTLNRGSGQRTGD